MTDVIKNYMIPMEDITEILIEFNNELKSVIDLRDPTNRRITGLRDPTNRKIQQHISRGIRTLVYTDNYKILVRKRDIYYIIFLCNNHPFTSIESVIVHMKLIEGNTHDVHYTIRCDGLKMYLPVSYISDIQGMFEELLRSNTKYQILSGTKLVTSVIDIEYLLNLLE
jgi:hypothetical protein